MMSLLYSTMISQGLIPTEMNAANLIPIPKNKNKSIKDADNYRAITISSIIGKLLDKIISFKYSCVFKTLDQQF